MTFQTEIIRISDGLIHWNGIDLPDSIITFLVLTGGKVYKELEIKCNLYKNKMYKKLKASYHLLI